MMEDNENFPLECNEKGKRRRKRTARRNLSDLSFILQVKVKLSFIGR